MRTLDERMELMDLYGLRLAKSDLFGKEPGMVCTLGYRTKVARWKDSKSKKAYGLHIEDALAEAHKPLIEAHKLRVEAEGGGYQHGNHKEFPPELKAATLRIAREELAKAGKGGRDAALRRTARMSGVGFSTIKGWLKEGL